MSDEHRAKPRQRVLKGARIVINNGYSTLQCTVRNLSETGARLKVASIIGVPDAFELLLDDGRKLACTVAWKTEFEIGVKFTA